MGCVLVTGGTRRLGKAISERLRADGWRVVTSSHRADAGADVIADLSDPLGAARLYAAASEAAGGTLDAIVNNAAILSGAGESILNVGFEAPRKLMTFLAGREDPGRRAVVNVLDAGLSERLPTDASAYMRAKASLREWTRRGAALFADTLRVNAVAPGPVFAPEDFHMKAGETLIGRPSAEDVASAVSFLLSNESMTGVILPVDGGQQAVWGDGPSADSDPERDIPVVARELVSRLASAGLVCATAESCTGGGVGSAITAVPGSSAVYRGGIVSYVNDVKRDLLDVPETVLNGVGAISGECAAFMAIGARTRLRADLAVSVTGLAGPGGDGTHPQGCVWFGLADATGARTENVVFPGDRRSVRAAAVRHAIELLALAADTCRNPKKRESFSPK